MKAFERISPMRACGLALLVLPALLLVQGCSTTIGFQVSGTVPSAVRPAVAYNPTAQQFLVAYLREVPGAPAGTRVARAQRFDAKASGLGSELAPFGTTGHAALGRPALAFGTKDQRYLLAIPASKPGGQGDTVLIRLLGANGQPVGKQHSLFSDQTWDYYDGDGLGSLDVAWNSVDNEFLITVQRTVQGTYDPENGIWAQRVSAAGSPQGQPVMLLNTGVHGIDSHALAYAPVAGGRYLFAYSGFAGGVVLLDKQAKSVAGVPLNLGMPKGGNTHPDAAFGTVDGKPRFLLVYSDEDNCRPGLKTCTALKDQWSGVWGAYVDPANPSAANTPFPISKIWAHVAERRSYKPRVSYHGAAKAFFVAWREVPTLNAGNDESRSHVRANWIDYLVPDGLAGTTQVPDPPANIVVSSSTGSCTTQGAMCLSLEDPVFPDAAATADGAVVVWQQNSPPNVGISSIVGRVLAAP